MVQYGKKGDNARARKIYKDGYYQMDIMGEKYPFPGFPRGYLLVGDGEDYYPPLSVLKHEIKNQIFNESWQKLEQGQDPNRYIRKTFDKIIEVGEPTRIDMIPPSYMAPVPREVWRAITEVEKTLDRRRAEKLRRLKEIACHILQEDDGYRFRFQWLAGNFKGKNLKKLKKVLQLLEHAEIVGDMKGKIRLFRRVVLTILEDEVMGDILQKIFNELDWKKIKLTKADKYYFRGKYFKCDYPKYDY